MPEHEAPHFLEASAYESIRYLMVDQAPLLYDDRTIERSFAGNMAKIILSRPDIFLLTHKSAIPLADSVRGYYQTLGYEIPEFGVVNTKDEEGANKEYPVGTSAWSQRARAYDDGRRQIVIAREAAILGPRIEGRRVAILDQFISDRVTVHTAISIGLSARAIRVVAPSSAAWFHDARQQDIDFDGLSSVHAPFMNEVGAAAAQIEMEVSLP
jgi:hypothetical protein